MTTTKIKFLDNIIEIEYNICPCLQCPIYPEQYKWENDKDIRNNMCFTSNCTYYQKEREMITNEIKFLKDNYFCYNCKNYILKEEIVNHSICPLCNSDLT